MKNALKQHFPMIRDRLELLEEIEKRTDLKAVFDSWRPEQQTEFLDFCTGVRGIKFLYDSFFKEILNPEYAPERLEELLSLLLGSRVRILEALPTDSTRIADESSLLIMDIVVQLDDGAIVNLEVQKIGYMFPGERSACYSADLLLRQYKRVRSEKKGLKQTFSYKDIKGVYTIVLFEKSPGEFQAFRDEYLHYFYQVSNTGLELNLLQKYLFIPLDIFRENQHNYNKAAESKLEAWLTFLSVDDPETIVCLIEAYPEFKPMYEEAYELCRNIEGVMHMFSKELAQLDRNTVQLMIDEMQDELKDKARKIDTQRQEIDSQKQEIDSQKQEIDSQKQEIDSQRQEIDSQRQEIDSQKQEIDSQKQEINSQKHKLEQAQAEKSEMIRRLYSSVKDTEQVSKMLGISHDAVREALEQKVE